MLLLKILFKAFDFLSQTCEIRENERHGKSMRKRKRKRKRETERKKEKEEERERNKAKERQ